MVAPGTGTAAAATVEPWPSATLLPATPAATVAPLPTTVALTLPLSVALLPITVEPRPATALEPTAREPAPVAVVV